jgi:FkbM family methyltransferase
MPHQAEPAGQQAMLLRFPHGLGDAVQLTTVLLHLRQLFPQWLVDVAVRPGAETMFAGLCRRAYRLGEEPSQITDGQPYHARNTLWFHEPDACYASSPATKAEKALREAFQIEPREEWCRYEIAPGDDARRRAHAYAQELAAACGLAEPDAAGESSPHAAREKIISRSEMTTLAGRYVLIHYQGNSARQNKNLDERAVAALCEEVIARGHIPVILDWDRRSGLVDQRRVFCPGGDHPLWDGRGHGDGATLAALAAGAAWCVGIDSGPGHVFGATATPTVIVWTRHHPLHYYGLSRNVTHLVPSNHRELLRGDRDLGLRYFEAKYEHRVYWDLERSLVLLAREFLPQASPWAAGPEHGREGRRPRRGARFQRASTAHRHVGNVLHVNSQSELTTMMVDGDLWVRRAHRLADMIVVRDVYLEDCYGVAELPRAPRYVVDVGAHLGAFARRLHRRRRKAAIVCVEADPANLAALRANVGDFATIVAAACTYEPGEVELFSTVFDGTQNTGGSTVAPWTNGQCCPPDSNTYCAAGPIPKVTLEEIVARQFWPRIDLLKLDCEGSELSILEHCDLALLRHVVGEYHDAARFHALMQRRFADWHLRILRQGAMGLFWLWRRA